MTSFEPRVHEKMDSLLAACKNGIVSGWDATVEFLMQENLAVHVRIRPDFVGVHSQNRARYGIDIVGCHQHGEQILQQGFSFKKASDATCIEVRDGVAPEDLAMNTETVALSNGLLPPLTSLKALSVGGAHANSFLRAARAQCTTPVQSLQDSVGRIDEGRFAGEDAKDAVENGLAWLQIDASVPATWPRVIDIAQQSLNAKAAQELIRQIHLLCGVRVRAATCGSRGARDLDSV